jgi:plastocyanin
MLCPRIYLTALLLAAGASAAGQPSAALVGRVEIQPDAVLIDRRPDVAALGMSAAPRVPEPRRSIVYLETAPRGAFEAREGRAVMDQRDEMFMPRVLAITAGTVVEFPNNDDTYHNVFSLSRTTRFDLGRYAKGRSRSVRFDRPGIVRVFCDIHSHMSAFILVFAHQFFAVTDDEGRYRIDRVPPGSYTVSVWSEGAQRASRSVTLPERGGEVELDFILPGTPPAAEPGQTGSGGGRQPR